MDYYVEKLLSANIILTNNCNSRCCSCDYWKQKVVNLDIGYIQQFFETLKKYGNESVVLTGGEPTLHPNFYEIVKIAKQYGFIIILSTNGSTINKIFDKVCDLIDSYCISFDGFSREQYYNIRGIDNYNNILKNIKMIKKYNENIQVWLGCLIQKKNFADIEKIYDVARKTRADGMFFNVPELKGGCFGRESGQMADEKLVIDKSDILKLERIFRIILKKDSDKGFLCQSEIAFHKFIEYFKTINYQIEPSKRTCFVPYNTITLTEYGKIRTCFYIDHELNISEDPVNCMEMVKLRQEMENNPIYRNQCNYCCQFNS